MDLKYAGRHSLTLCSTSDLRADYNGAIMKTPLKSEPSPEHDLLIFFPFILQICKNNNLFIHFIET